MAKEGGATATQRPKTSQRKNETIKRTTNQQLTKRTNSPKTVQSNLERVDQRELREEGQNVLDLEHFALFEELHGTFHVLALRNHVLGDAEPQPLTWRGN
jgi:hypothetical protein